MKKFIHLVFIACGLFVAAFLAIAIYHMTQSVDGNNHSKLEDYISLKDHVDGVTIKKTAVNGELLGVLYTEKSGAVRLMLLEQDKLIKNRYRYFGGSSGARKFGTYNFGNPKWALIVVYGDNTSLRAARYKMLNSSITYMEDIQGMDYVLRIFRLAFTDDISCKLSLLDAGNQEVFIN